MDEKDWRLLRALRDTRSITKSAKMLNTSQPGLSKRLRALEEQFGTSIALRNKNGIEFTPAGEYLVQFAVDMLDQLRRMQEQISDIGSEIKGTLRIGASNYSVSFLLPDILAAYKRKHPLVEFLVITDWSSDILKMVSSGEVHIGFVRNNNAPSAERILLCTERTFICSTKKIDLQSLPDEPQIAYRSDPLVTAWMNLWWAQHYKRPPKIGMMLDRLSSSVELVLQGLGWAFLTEKITERMPGIQRYELKHPDGQSYARHTWVVSNQDARQLRMVAGFLDFIAKRAYE
ncbi:MAG: LysR family transcriptional regulator [Deltaproteobacteria bacterium]|jgi:DNA-binding transcriptional LysR family regulator|nr:LysR family transcriptional regulator [Deltaproteobacteria bacterium]